MRGKHKSVHTPLFSVYSSNWKNLDFNALLWQVLYIFAFVVSWLIYE